MVARGQGIILDGFGAYPADGRVVGAVGAGGVGGSDLVGGRRRRGVVCRLVIATASSGFVRVRLVAVVGTASASTVAPSFAVLRGRGSRFGRCRGRHGCRVQGRCHVI